MPITLRPSEERGRTRIGWLDARHSFSFGDYRDPAHLGYRGLRVINEDRVAPGGGFEPHPHRDMEIVTYLLEGALRHEDSGGNTGVLQPGDAQAMTAGSGVVHSERNASTTEPAHLLQIWIRPTERGTEPRYADLKAPGLSTDGLRLLATGHGEAGALPIGADARVFEVRLAAGATIDRPIEPGRGAWVQVASGHVHVNGQALGAGDGAAVDDEPSMQLRAGSDTLALLFDLA
jgi:redox-sensitive bicupin YhaK (pirin superfamily)